MQLLKRSQFVHYQPRRRLPHFLTAADGFPPFCNRTFSMNWHVLAILGGYSMLRSQKAANQTSATFSNELVGAFKMLLPSTTTLYWFEPTMHGAAFLTSWRIHQRTTKLQQYCFLILKPIQNLKKTLCYNKQVAWCTDITWLPYGIILEAWRRKRTRLYLIIKSRYYSIIHTTKKWSQPICQWNKLDMLKSKWN
jgi:hypothetical protein